MQPPWRRRHWRWSCPAVFRIRPAGNGKRECRDLARDTNTRYAEAHQQLAPLTELLSRISQLAGLQRRRSPCSLRTGEIGATAHAVRQCRRSGSAELLRGGAQHRWFEFFARNQGRPGRHRRKWPVPANPDPRLAGIANRDTHMMRPRRSFITWFLLEQASGESNHIERGRRVAPATFGSRSARRTFLATTAGVLLQSRSSNGSCLPCPARGAWIIIWPSTGENRARRSPSRRRQDEMRPQLDAQLTYGLPDRLGRATGLCI